LKVKRSSGAIESGWQLAADAKLDANGMVELVMGELSRGMHVDELMQLNADASAQVPLDQPDAPPPLPRNLPAAPPVQPVSVPSLPPLPFAIPDPASDVLAPFRGKNLKVKRSSGAIEGGWQLAADAKLDANGMVELVMGELMRATTMNELVRLNSELVRVARGELTPEEILAGLCMGQDVFQSGPRDRL